MLPPFLVIFYRQRALNTLFPIVITTFRVAATPDIRRLMRIDFISVSISYDTSGDLPTFFIEKILNFFLFWNDFILCFQVTNCFSFNPFIPNALFHYPLKTSENLTLFWCFQGVEKGCIVNQVQDLNALFLGLVFINIISVLEDETKFIRM